jgi:hypothetical protein
MVANYLLGQLREKNLLVKSSVQETAEAEAARLGVTRREKTAP